MSDYSKNLYIDENKKNDIYDSTKLMNSIELDFSEGMISKSEKLCVEYICDLGYDKKIYVGGMSNKLIDECKEKLKNDFSDRVIDKCINYISDNLIETGKKYYWGDDIEHFINRVNDNILLKGNAGLEDIDIWRDFSFCNDDVKQLFASMMIRDIILYSRKIKQNGVVDKSEIVNLIRDKFDLSDILLIRSIVEIEEKLIESSLKTKKKELNCASVEDIFSLSNVGDIIKLGRYDNQDIEWIIISRDKNTIKMISKDILCKSTFYFYKQDKTMGYFDLDEYLKKRFVWGILDRKLIDNIVTIRLPEYIDLPSDKTSQFNNERCEYWLRYGRSIINKGGKLLTGGFKDTDEEYGLRPYVVIKRT